MGRPFRNPAHLIALDETPPIDVNDQAPPTTIVMGAPEQIESADPLSERLDDILGPALLLVVELGDKSSLLSVCVSSDETVDHG